VTKTIGILIGLSTMSCGLLGFYGFKDNNMTLFRYSVFISLSEPIFAFANFLIYIGVSKIYCNSVWRYFIGNFQLTQKAPSFPMLNPWILRKNSCAGFCCHVFICIIWLAHLFGFLAQGKFPTCISFYAFLCTMQ